MSSELPPVHMRPVEELLSFCVGKRSSGESLVKWERKAHSDDGTHATTAWTDPETGLVASVDIRRFASYPAVEWLLSFENVGAADTPVLREIRPLDLVLRAPLDANAPYVLHRTNGAPSNPTDFEPSRIALDSNTTVRMSGGGGRSSNRDFPFFKIDSDAGSTIVAVGWSGQWSATVAAPDGNTLRAFAGLERARFYLRPGERVRMPRILLLHHEGESDDANALFRSLIHEHYCIQRNGIPPEPILFSNTCFTRGGEWLNECNAENQISLIRAYGELGLEAVITDAGWFEGGWPNGVGNWTPRVDSYPNGMAPVAAAAKEEGGRYGLWFEPERVVGGSWVHREHPDWCLASSRELLWTGVPTYLLDFGNPDARDWFFGVVAGFMALDGFSVYRQDCNIDPLDYWHENDEPDRAGLTEIRYIEGLYAYWDRIRTTWPDCILEECASGGRRIDLETIMRFDVHQKTDYWFDADADQAHLFGTSQYLPNNVIVAHVDDLDEYSFHSALASSLCVGWIADDAGFDMPRAKELADRYRAVRHLLTGEWYPLAPYERGGARWMASQYHRPDLGEGIVLAFRHGESNILTYVCELRGLARDAWYELVGEDGDETVQLMGGELMDGLTVTLPEPRSSALIRYRRV